MKAIQLISGRPSPLPPIRSQISTRGDWRRRETARRSSRQTLRESPPDGVGWSLIWTAILWMLLFGSLSLVFRP